MWLLFIITVASGAPHIIETSNEKSCKELKERVETYYKSEFGELTDLGMRFKCVEK